MTAQARPLRANRAEVAAEIIDGEAILINLSTSRYYSLEGTGAVVWSLIERGADQAAIVDELVRRFAAERPVVDAQVAALVDELLAERLVVEASPGDDTLPTAPVEPDAAPEAPGVYQPPRLETYTDMEDLLALDPPMPGLKDIAWNPPST